MLIENALGVVNLLAFIEISLIVSRSENRRIDRSRSEGKYRNFTNFQSLSLLVDTSGGFKNRNFDFG